MDEVIIDSKQDPPTTDGPILMQQDGIYHLTEGKSSVVEFKPGQSSHSQLIQDESLHNVAQVSQHHLQAAMASVTELRNESREMHLAEPDLGRLNIRQYEYLNNSLRKSLRMTTGADAINDTDSFGGAEEGAIASLEAAREAEDLVAAVAGDVAPLNAGHGSNGWGFKSGKGCCSAGVGEHVAHPVVVALINHGHGAQVALALRALMVEQVIAERAPTHELAAARDTETLGCGPAGLELWHVGRPAHKQSSYGANLPFAKFFVYPVDWPNASARAGGGVSFGSQGNRSAPQAGGSAALAHSASASPARG